MDDPQVEAQKKNSLPEGVEQSAPLPAEEINKDGETAKPKLDEFGFATLDDFINKVKHDSQFAERVARKAVGLDEGKPLQIQFTGNAPQEKNITGTLDHSEYPPKVKEAA